MRQIRYQEIADDLRQRVASEEFTRNLPSEAELSGAYNASRVTIRKALESLRDQGLVDSRQGYGWFVAADPVRQTLGRLGTIEDQLRMRGIQTERRILDFAFVEADEPVALVLGVSSVLRVRRVNLADGLPFARVTVWCPQDLATSLSLADVERTSFYELIPVKLGGAVQTIGAGRCSADDGDVLGVEAGSPILRCERHTRAEDGRVVLVSEHVFPFDRTEFVVDLPQADRSMAPTGMRLREQRKNTK